ncbi:Signal recognition particle protein Ffh [Planctomycetales bacterium 10988]|nr:Signal recognition particle protein Ffh [Planctomycetales bacterium 10988]
MFESLQTGLVSAFKTLSGKGKLTEANMRDGLEMVRDALYEADVSAPVVKEFLKNVSEQAQGEKVLTKLNPTEQLSKIVYDELVNLMGPVDNSVRLESGLTIIMMCGLQGSGKTTTCGKLAKMLKEQGKQPMMAAADLQRPAAIEQLKVVGSQIQVPVYSEAGQQNPVTVCQQAVKEAKKQEVDVLILDTAGRLHVDDELMQELTRIDNRVQPHHVFLVVDSNTGQDAVNSAKSFNEALELNGVILTKLDGDARGGAAISVKHVTGVPIKFIGTGEHLIDLEPFVPEQIAGRILGQGDIMSLIQRADRVIDEDEKERVRKQIEEGQFNLEIFRDQLSQVSKLGPVTKLLGMMPGMNADMMKMVSGSDAEKNMRQIRGIIDSMTVEERRHPNPSKFLDHSRRRRIAAGSGVQPHEVNQIVQQAETMGKMMKTLSGKGMMDRMKMMRELTGEGMMNPRGMLPGQKQSTGKRLTGKERQQHEKERAKDRRKRKRDRRRK